MLSIGEFSNICRVSTKTLRYYAEIGLLQPYRINPENGYRYYAIEQLETMLLIERLKAYDFSLEKIKQILQMEKGMEESLYKELLQKKQDMIQKAKVYAYTISQLEQDISNLEEGKSMLAYMEDIDIQLVEVQPMNVIFRRCMVKENAFQKAYQEQFGALLRCMESEKLTIEHPPMVLFHSSEFTPMGMDTEFAIPIKEHTAMTRCFHPECCIKCTLQGSYSNLAAIYTKLWEWMEVFGYQQHGPLFEVYVKDPTQVEGDEHLLTEVYLPVEKNKK